MLLDHAHSDAPDLQAYRGELDDLVLDAVEAFGSTWVQDQMLDDQPELVTA